jgi:peptide deformylase
VNPEIVERQGKRMVNEACLSIPDYQGELLRSIWVKVKVEDRYGKGYRIKGEELLAQALEHEVDHLYGILYTDHLESFDKLQRLVPEGSGERVVVKMIRY